MSARADFLAGVRDEAPILVSVIPFALITGITAVNAGIPPLQAIAMSIIVFAGAAQLAAIELIGQTAPIAVIVFTAIIINLRFTMYSASIAPYFRRFTRPWRWIGAYILTDEAYAVCIPEFRRTTAEERSRKWYYLGAALVFWATWQLGTILGVVIGASVPRGQYLEFAVPLTFMALLFPNLEDRPSELAALSAGVIAVVAAGLPYNLSLMVGALSGITVGVLLDWRGYEADETESEDEHEHDSRESEQEGEWSA